jgi:hypothetical protein
MMAGPTAQSQASGIPGNLQLQNPWDTASSPAPKPASKTTPTDTRISKPAKRSKRKAKAPKDKRRTRPPKVTGYTWRKDGAGWELRKLVYVETDTGIRKRRLPYVAHLSKSAFGELKRRHKGAALERAVAAWIAEHDK